MDYERSYIRLLRTIEALQRKNHELTIIAEGSVEMLKEVRNKLGKELDRDFPGMRGRIRQIQLATYVANTWRPVDVKGTPKRMQLLSEGPHVGNPRALVKIRTKLGLVTPDVRRRSHGKSKQKGRGRVRG